MSINIANNCNNKTNSTASRRCKSIWIGHIWSVGEIETQFPLCFHWLSLSLLFLYSYATILWCDTCGLCFACYYLSRERDWFSRVRAHQPGQMLVKWREASANKTTMCKFETIYSNYYNWCNLFKWIQEKMVKYQLIKELEHEEKSDTNVNLHYRSYGMES